MLKSETKIIGNDTFTVKQLGAKRGRAVLTRVIKTFGPVLAQLVRDVDPQAIRPGAPPRIGGEALAAALAEFAERLGPDDLDYYCAIFGPESEVAIGSTDKVLPLDAQNQEHYFAGNYHGMFGWLAFCFEVNYSGFFADLAGAAAVLAPVAPLAKASE